MRRRRLTITLCRFCSRSFSTLTHVFMVLGFVILLSWINMMLKMNQQSFRVELRHPGFDSSSFTNTHHATSFFRSNNNNLTSTTTTLTSYSEHEQHDFGTGDWWKMKPTHHACDNYSGILHIESGDEGAAAGTVFFQYVLNQLIYAEMYNLKPFIHLSNLSQHVFDPVVHGGGGDGGNGADTNVISFSMLHGLSVRWISDGYKRLGFGSYPGRPVPPLLLDLDDNNDQDYREHLTRRIYTITGTGIWNHYFLPVSDFVPGDVSCRDKPLIKMHYYHLRPSLLYSCPWSLKSWPYSFMPKRLKPRQGLQDWYRPMRQRGHEIAQKYLKFQPHIVELANKANPPKDIVRRSEKSGSSNDDPYEYCLAMHIRHSDKGGLNRKRIELESFLPYAEAYQKAGGKRIYVATDSGNVVTTILGSWPESVRNLVKIQGYRSTKTKSNTDIRADGNPNLDNTQRDDRHNSPILEESILRSDSKKSVFQLYSHHRTNTEVLVDILALSKCTFFIHGFSAVSEAAIYLNFPTLHKFSVDLEKHPHNRPPTSQQFQQTVHRVLMGKA